MTMVLRSALEKLVIFLSGGCNKICQVVCRVGLSGGCQACRVVPDNLPDSFFYNPTKCYPTVQRFKVAVQARARA